MGKATKTKVAAVNVDFEADRAKLFAGYSHSTEVQYFDWKPLGEILVKYQGDEKLFTDLRMMCREHSILRYAKKYQIAQSEADAAKLARYDRQKDPTLPELTESQKAMRKAAANDWFTFTARVGYKTPETRGGANNVKPKAAKLTDRQSTVKPAPVTVESYIPAECEDIAALRSTYISVKSLLVKLQARNAKVYQGDEGSKLLAIHKNVIELLNGIK